MTKGDLGSGGRHPGPGAITLLTRTFFLIPRRELPMPGWLPQGLRYAPLAALAAVLVPEIVMTQGEADRDLDGCAVVRGGGGERVVLLAARHPGHHRQRQHRDARAAAGVGLVGAGVAHGS